MKCSFYPPGALGDIGWYWEVSHHWQNVSPQVTEPAPYMEQVLPNEVSAHYWCQCQNYWETTESIYTSHEDLVMHNQPVKYHQLLKVCQPKPILEKLTEHVPFSPTRQLYSFFSKYVILSFVFLIKTFLARKVFIIGTAPAVLPEPAFEAWVRRAMLEGF